MGVTLLLLAGSALTAGATAYSAISQQAAANRTAARLDRDAETARLVGAQQAEAALEDSRRAQGAAVAEAGASGFGVDGSIFDGLAALNRAGQTDAANARYEAQQRATSLNLEGQEQRIAGRSSLITGLAGAGGSLISGAGVAIASRRA